MSMAHPRMAASQIEAGVCGESGPSSRQVEAWPRKNPIPDEGILRVLGSLIGSVPDAGPGGNQSSLVDSMWRANPGALEQTLAFVITSPLQFAVDQAAGSAELYRLLGGSPEWVAWALLVPALDQRRIEVVNALPLRPQQDVQELLYWQACSMSVALGALTPVLPRLRAMGAQIGPPQWYAEWLWLLDQIERRLSAPLRERYDREIAPFGRAARQAASEWPRRQLPEPH